MGEVPLCEDASLIGDSLPLGPHRGPGRGGVSYGEVPLHGDASLMGSSLPLGPCWGPGKGGVSYEQGTPVGLRILRVAL